MAGFNKDWLTEKFPEYSDLQILASGGQKVVYTASHPKDGNVVLKLFHLGTSGERCVRELDAISILKSDRVPTIFESGLADSEVGEVIWVRERRVFGSDLRAILRGRAPTNQLIYNIALHCLEVLCEAEKCRIVHRDIKPENIIVDEASNGWLLDFGIVRHLDRDALTRVSAQYGLGTLGYIAPEQLKNFQAEIDIRSDLFSLGVTIYECCEGVNPFLAGARDQLDVIRRLERQALPAINRQIDADNNFGDLILAMTRTQRNHRVSTAQEALDWLKDITPK